MSAADFLVSKEINTDIKNNKMFSVMYKLINKTKCFVYILCFVYFCNAVVEASHYVIKHEVTRCYKNLIWSSICTKNRIQYLAWRAHALRYESFRCPKNLPFLSTFYQICNSSVKQSIVIKIIVAKCFQRFILRYLHFPHFFPPFEWSEVQK